MNKGQCEGKIDYVFLSLVCSEYDVTSSPVLSLHHYPALLTLAHEIPGQGTVSHTSLPTCPRSKNSSILLEILGYVKGGKQNFTSFGALQAPE